MTAHLPRLPLLVDLQLPTSLSLPGCVPFPNRQQETRVLRTVIPRLSPLLCVCFCRGMLTSAAASGCLQRADGLHFGSLDAGHTAASKCKKSPRFRRVAVYCRCSCSDLAMLRSTSTSMSKYVDSTPHLHFSFGSWSTHSCESSCKDRRPRNSTTRWNHAPRSEMLCSIACARLNRMLSERKKMQCVHAQSWCVRLP
jgi:hypothetical protein